MGDDVIGEVKGNWRSKEFEILIHGAVAATVNRKGLNFASVVFDADTYFVHVKPMQDRALMSLIVIALDELYHDKQRCDFKSFRPGLGGRLGD